MKKPSATIKLISVLLFLYPVFMLAEYFIISEHPKSFSVSHGFAAAFWFIFYGILGYGVLKLNRRSRLAAIIVLVFNVAGPLLALILMPIVNGPLFLQALKVRGAYAIIWLPLLVFFVAFGPSLLYCLFVIFQLTRSKVNDEFLTFGPDPSVPGAKS